MMSAFEDNSPGSLKLSPKRQRDFADSDDMTVVGAFETPLQKKKPKPDPNGNNEIIYIILFVCASYISSECFFTV